MDIASHVRSPKERAILLVQLVQRLGPSQKREVVLGLLEQARGLIGGSDRAEDQEEMNALLLLAQAYLTVEPKRSFDVIEPLVDQVNEMSMAAASLNGFGQKYLQDGELLMENGNSVGVAASQLIVMIGALATLDFDHAKGLADKLQRPEVRLAAYLGIAEQTMSPPSRIGMPRLGMPLMGIPGAQMTFEDARSTIDGALRY
jgi:hypothetical protein